MLALVERIQRGIRRFNEAFSQLYGRAAQQV